MPLVTISILKGKSPAYIKAVTDGINLAVIETMGFPADDRYQVVHELAPECLQLQEREGDRVVMHLVMRAGRSNKAKQAFYRRVVEKLAADPGILPEHAGGAAGLRRHRRTVRRLGIGHQPVPRRIAAVHQCHAGADCRSVVLSARDLAVDRHH